MYYETHVISCNVYIFIWMCNINNIICDIIWVTWVIGTVCSLWSVGQKSGQCVFCE